MVDLYNGDIDEGTHTPPPYWKLIRTIRDHFTLVCFLIACLASGTMMPLFSFLPSPLFFEVSIGAQDTNATNRFGGLVLGTATRNTSSWRSPTCARVRCT